MGKGQLGILDFLVALLFWSFYIRKEYYFLCITFCAELGMHGGLILFHFIILFHLSL